MAGENVKPLARTITCHAWNGAMDQVAISPNSNRVNIYSVTSNDPATWKRIHTLDEHDSLVSGIDWSPVSNLIVTCGHDRNAYVWKFVDGTWQPTLVILRINRAATAVKWSISGNKFAVTSCAKVVPVCHYEQGNDWWVSKTIKKHKSTVVALDWHRNNKFIVTGSCDFKCRIFSAFVEEVDEDADAEVWAEIFPKQHSFGALLAEFEASKGWVEAVRWAPSGFRLAFAGHDSSVHLVQILAGEPPLVQTIHVDHLPYVDLAFLSDNTLVAAGYDANPMLFVAGGTDAEPIWEFAEPMDKSSQGKNEGGKKKGNAFNNARLLFDDSTRKGIKFGDSTEESEVKTVHKNTINGIFPFWDSEFTASRFSTCGIDGRVVTWDLRALGYDLAAIGLQ